MFNLRDFVFKGLKDAIGKMADYQVILNAMGWFEKNVLTQEDLASISEAIDKNNEKPENQEFEIPTDPENPINPEFLEESNNTNLYKFDNNMTQTENGVTCTYDKDTGIFTFNGKMDTSEKTVFMNLDNVLKFDENVKYRMSIDYVNGSFTEDEERVGFETAFLLVPKGTRLANNTEFAYGITLGDLNADNPSKFSEFTTDSEIAASNIGFVICENYSFDFKDYQIIARLEVVE